MQNASSDQIQKKPKFGPFIVFSGQVYWFPLGTKDTLKDQVRDENIVVSDSGIVLYLEGFRPFVPHPEILSDKGEPVKTSPRLIVATPDPTGQINAVPIPNSFKEGDKSTVGNSYWAAFMMASSIRAALQSGELKVDISLIRKMEADILSKKIEELGLPSDAPDEEISKLGLSVYDPVRKPYPMMPRIETEFSTSDPELDMKKLEESWFIDWKGLKESELKAMAMLAKRAEESIYAMLSPGKVIPNGPEWLEKYEESSLLKNTWDMNPEIYFGYQMVSNAADRYWSLGKPVPMCIKPASMIESTKWANIRGCGRWDAEFAAIDAYMGDYNKRRTAIESMTFEDHLVEAVGDDIQF